MGFFRGRGGHHPLLIQCFASVMGCRESLHGHSRRSLVLVLIALVCRSGDRQSKDEERFPFAPRTRSCWPFPRVPRSRLSILRRGSYFVGLSQICVGLFPIFVISHIAERCNE